MQDGPKSSLHSCSEKRKKSDEWVLALDTISVIFGILVAIYDIQFTKFILDKFRGDLKTFQEKSKGATKEDYK